MNDQTDSSDPGQRLRTLNVRQQLALPVLLNRGTHQAAADAAGVQRTTVTYWVNHHPAFQAALNAHDHALNRELLAKRLKGAALVLDRLLEGIENGDERAIEQWVRHIGVDVLADDTIGSADPDEIIEQRVEPRAKQAAADSSAARVADLAPDLMRGSTRPEVRRKYEAELAATLDQLEDSDATQGGTDQDPSQNDE